MDYRQRLCWSDVQIDLVRVEYSHDFLRCSFHMRNTDCSWSCWCYLGRRCIFVGSLGCDALLIARVESPLFCKGFLMHCFPDLEQTYQVTSHVTWVIHCDQGSSQSRKLSLSLLCVVTKAYNIFAKKRYRKFLRLNLLKWIAHHYHGWLNLAFRDFFMYTFLVILLRDSVFDFWCHLSPVFI